MNVKIQLLAAASSTLFFLSSCQKDLTLKEESLQGEEISNDATANSVVETTHPVHTSVKYNVNSNVAGFWQTVPARYNLTTKKYPLIVFIHGIGELGTSLSKINCCGLPKHLNNKTFPANFNVNGANYSFIVISPQFKKRPTAAQVQSVIDYAKRRWRVDDTRVYVTGLSMGGGSTWDWSAVYGQNAAAIVPVCGGTKPTTTLASKIAAKNLPIWGLYSTSDAVVPVQWGRNFFSWIDARNTGYASKTKLTIWTDANHNTTWARAFNPNTKIDGYNIYRWMLLYKRGTASASPAPSGTNKIPVASAGSDKTIYLRTGTNRVLLNGLGSKDPDGTIKSYSWRKLSGPSTDLWKYKTGQYYAAHLVQGTYVFRLTVTDNKGATDIDDVKVVVHPWSTHVPSTNKTPVARAGLNKTIYLHTGVNRVLLNATASSDPDGYITKYVWSKVSGPNADLWTYKKGQSYTAHLVKGTYVFKVVITDNKGKTAMDDIVVYVKS